MLLKYVKKIFAGLRFFYRHHQIWSPLRDTAVKPNILWRFENSWQKKFFFSVFRKWKVEETSITYFHSKLVNIYLQDQKFDQTFLKIQNMYSDHFHEKW